MAACSLPWVEKFRPTCLQDVSSHKREIQTLERLIEQNAFPHILLWGPPGNGKTSVALACARAINGDRWRSMVFELNASDDRSIDVVRQQIKNFSSMGTLSTFSASGEAKPARPLVKFILLDEADHMPVSAQFALRRIMEKCSSNVRFCLTANHVNKIIPSLQSRCTRFRFPPLPLEDIVLRLEHILAAERILVDRPAVLALARVAKGDMRVCLNLAQICCSTHTPTPTTTIDTLATAAPFLLTEKMVYESAGLPTPQETRQFLAWHLGSTTATMAAESKQEEEEDVDKDDTGKLQRRAKTLADAIGRATEFLAARGLKIGDILGEVQIALLDWQHRFAERQLAHWYEFLATLEFRLACGGLEAVQLAAFSSALYALAQ